MCDAEKHFVAWLDGELPAEEAASVERHVAGCEECRGRMAAFRRVSGAVNLYCDAVMAAKARPRFPRWTMSALAFAGAAGMVFFVARPRTRIAPPPVLGPTVADASEIQANSAATISAPAVHTQTASPRLVKSVQRKTTLPRRTATAHGQTFSAEMAKWQPAESAVQIAIPADAMFPPGAMPKGLNFVAELSIGPDGSVRQVRLRQ